jgi:choline dehydrogenase-like flavoprotein
MPILLDAIQRATFERTQEAGLHDAIVVGAGATGGLAARLLTEAGLRVLVLDAGVPREAKAAGWRDLYRAATRRLIGRAAVERGMRERQPVQSQCYAWRGSPDAFVDDVDNPYTTAPGHPFLWFRSRQLGGRMAVPGHGRQYYRLASTDFDPPDRLTPPWPFGPGEMDGWYALVERQLGLAGRYEHNPHVPDSHLARELDLSDNERDLIASIVARWPGTSPILSRFAGPSRPLDDAARTDRLLVRTGAIVKGLDVDAQGRIQTVRWVDVQARQEGRASAPLVFLCASGLESTRLLLLSRSPRHPGGLGSGSGVLGRNVMDHIRVRLTGLGPPVPSEPPAEPGRCVYLPRFDARESALAMGRGFGVQVYRAPAPDGTSTFGASAYGEMLPRPDNRVVLDEHRRDAWGIPVLHISCRHGADDVERGRDQRAALIELAARLGVKPLSTDAEPAPPGTANHECGSARMGTAPENSVVDPHNECWDARGLYITDGCCLPSQGMQNPTLTLLALTARACHHALGRLNPNQS